MEATKAEPTHHASIVTFDGRSFHVGDRVKYLLGYQGQVLEILSPVRCRVEWDIRKVTDSLFSDLVNLSR